MVFVDVEVKLLMHQHSPEEVELGTAEDDEVDGCSCEFLDKDATQDEDLPAAVGGIG